MNEFLEQFVIEARELIAQATQDLLALEHAPADRARLDSAFRAFHTLKGGAGIVDFAAMAAVAHAVEDMLSGARAGTRPFSGQRIDLCLAGLDQMTLWLDAAAATATFPADADAVAGRLVARFSGAAGPEPAAPPAPGPGLARDATARVPRVEMARIDAIVKLAGELMVAKNALGQALDFHATDDKNPARRNIETGFARLERLTAELLRAALGARVLPLRQVFQRFPRLVRDMGEGLGKPVRLITEGEATEADKAVVEALFEPILHLLRNAVDHGIEAPAARAAAAKASPAIIRLAARREGAQVVIEISDDGGGMDVPAIRATAARRGLISPAAAAALPAAEVLQLIFVAGFSTANEVTAISGRGVGMDAVRAAIEQLGGRIGIQTDAGVGTTIRLTLPFTVMLTKVLTVEAGGQIFGVPFDAVVETRHISAGGVFAIGAARAVCHRGGTIPLVDLASGLNLAPPAPGSGEVAAVIVEHAGACAAIAIDRFGGQLDVMLKPLEGLLTGMPGIAGTTLLGDGRVLIVLELYELLK